MLDYLDLSDVTAIHFDETSARKGHRYTTFISDTVGKRNIFIDDSRVPICWH